MIGTLYDLLGGNLASRVAVTVMGLLALAWLTRLYSLCTACAYVVACPTIHAGHDMTSVACMAGRLGHKTLHLPPL